MFSHKHAIKTYPTVELKDREIRRIYVVETDLALSEDDPRYDADAFVDFADALRDYLHDNPVYDSVRVDPVRQQ